MRSTSELRKLWAPACEFTKRRLALHSGATLAGLNADVYEAFQALDAIMRTSGYMPRANTATAWETGAYNCRKITNGSGYSLHAYGIAADINARTNPYGAKLVTDMPYAMVAAIKALKTKGGLQVFRWGGDYRRNKDAMHYEVVVSPDEISVGIDWATASVEPPNPHAPTTWPTLRRGDRGPTVRKLADLLRAAGFEDVNPGNSFGSKTFASVTRDSTPARSTACSGAGQRRPWSPFRKPTGWRPMGYAGQRPGGHCSHDRLARDGIGDFDEHRPCGTRCRNEGRGRS